MTTTIAAIRQRNAELLKSHRQARDDLCAAYGWPREIITVAPLETPSPAFVAERGRVERRAGVNLRKFFLVGA